MKTFLLVLTLLIYSSLNATTWYISPSGNDVTGNGTSANPWKTLFKATSTITANGDIIHVNAGTYTETVQIVLSPGVSIEGEGNTSIIKSNYNNRFGGILKAVSATGTNGNQHISNLKFDGQLLYNSNCLEIQGRSNFSLHDLTIQDFVYSGIIMNGEDHYISTAPSVYATGNSIYNCTINNCAGYIAGTLEGCIQIGGQVGALIYNNVITQNQRAAGSNGEPIKYYSEGFLYGCKIYNNVLTRALSNGLDWNFNIEFFNEGGLEIYNNTLVNGSIDLNKNTKNGYEYSAWIHDNTFTCSSPNTLTQTGVQLEFNSAYVIIEKNHFIQYSNIINFTPRTGDTVKNIIIKNNLAESMVTTAAQNGSFIGGFSDGGGTFYLDSMFVYHNTVTGSVSGLQNYWAIDLGNAALGYSVNHVYIKNNIISNFSSCVRNQSQGRFYNSNIQYNNFFGNGNNTPMLAWPSSTLLDPSTIVNNNLSVSPLYLASSNYQLQSSSPLIDAGINVGLIFNGTAPDIGYWEYGGVSSNIAPTASAGVDQTITLPTNSVSLTGSGNDPDGSIIAYLWTKVSGPAAGSITNPSTAATTVTALVAGIYKFELRVTDNSGAVARDTMQVIVFAPNIPPTANAGLDQSITLPTNTADLLGSGSDIDGTIVSYKWTKISGPVNGIISNPASAVTTVTGLTQGIYQFELKITDNNGASATDIMQVTVNAANIPPVANAGPDHSILLPLNSVTLNGSGTDIDGTVISYKWRQISGPADKLTSLNTPVTVLTTMIEGIYQFELTVTDNKGAIDIDTTVVTVGFVAAPSVNKINVFPNPVINSTTLSINNTTANSKVLIVITDLLGKSIYKKQLTIGNYTANEQIDMSNLSKGVYLITVYFDALHQNTVKVVKAN